MTYLKPLLWLIEATLAIAALVNSARAEPVLLDFTASWCQPCQQMAPVIAELERAGYPVRKVDIDTNRALAARYGVSVVPTFIVVDDGKELARESGVMSVGALVAMFPVQHPEVTVDVPEQDAAKLFRAFDAVCRVKSRESDGAYGVGTGFVYKVDDSGIFLLTNAHVAATDTVEVEFCRNGKIVKAVAGRTVRRSQLRANEEGQDLASVQVARDAIPFTPAVMKIGTREDVPTKGQVIYSIGCPRGEWPNMWKGFVEVVEPRRIQFWPAPAGGRSGSMLIDDDGETVIGIIAWRGEAGGRAMNTVEIRDFFEGMKSKPMKFVEDLIRVNDWYYVEVCPTCPPQQSPQPYIQPKDLLPYRGKLLPYKHVRPDVDDSLPDSPSRPPVDVLPIVPIQPTPAPIQKGCCDGDCCKCGDELKALRVELNTLKLKLCEMSKQAGPEGKPGRDGKDCDPETVVNLLLAKIDYKKIASLVNCPPPAPAPIERERHIVIVADQNADSWPRLRDEIKSAQQHYSGIRIAGPPKFAVPLPQIVAYENGVPVKVIKGSRKVSEALMRVARGEQVFFEGE